jgi:hypothetical protein
MLRSEKLELRRYWYFGSILIIAGFSIVSCGGSNTGGSQDYTGTEFVSDDESVGSISLALEEKEVSVGDTTELKVSAVNSLGAPVSNLQIACDTEGELALIEPQTGRFMTGSGGVASGVVGCSANGSFAIGCRIANGGGRRKFEHIKCTGEPPVDFAGFPGAAGGGLGGGVFQPTPAPNQDIDDLRGLRIASLEIDTIGGEPDVAPDIDLQGGVCDSGTPTDPSDDTVEPFGNDTIVIGIVNDSNETVNLTGFRYTVQNGASNGGTYTSPLIKATGVATPSGTIDLAGIIFTSTNSGKAYANNNTVIPANLGLRNVSITVEGESASGQPVEINASFAADFDNFNYCPAS